MSNTEQEKAPQAEAEKKPTGPPKSIFREYFESFSVTLIMAIFGMTFIIQAVTVPTGSMQNTILVGDYLLVNKFIFSPGGNPLPFLPMRDIERGDIIVFKYPGNSVDPESDRDRGLVKYQINYVKRVIALPGEKVEFKNNQVFINDQPLAEHRIIGDPPRGDSNGQSALVTQEFEEREAADKWDVYYSERTMRTVESGGKLRLDRLNFAVEGKPMIVPENSFFAMGDSRDQSDDGRGWGFVPRDLIVGRAMFVYWSCDRGASNGSWAGCLTNPRLDRIFKFVK
jgi:signal peptidase I, bacterial type